MACPTLTVPNATHTACIPFTKPLATTPGLLEPTPGLGSQGPASSGTPLGGAPAGGAKPGGAGIR
jgi:hypothetical protein